MLGFASKWGLKKTRKNPDFDRVGQVRISHWALKCFHQRVEFQSGNDDARHTARRTRIFAVAIKITDPEAREAYLSQACDNDSALFDRVSSLLEANEKHPKFLEDRPAELNPTLTHAESTKQEG